MGSIYINGFFRLIEKGKADISRTDQRENQNILMLAVSGGHINVVQYLVRYKVISLNETDKKGKTALRLGCRAGHLNVVKLLIEEGKDKACEEFKLAFITAAEYGHVDILKYMLEECEQKVDINSLDRGLSVLHYGRNHFEVVKYLLAANITVISSELQYYSEDTRRYVMSFNKVMFFMGFHKRLGRQSR